MTGDFKHIMKEVEQKKTGFITKLVEVCAFCEEKAQIGDLCNQCWQDLELTNEHENEID